MAPTSTSTPSDQLQERATGTMVYFNDLDQGRKSRNEAAPERPERTASIRKAFEETSILEMCVERNCDRIANDDELLMVHTKRMIEEWKKTETMSDEELTQAGKRLNNDFLERKSLRVARKSVGTLLQAVDELYEVPAGQRNGFVATRPPGHLATRSKSAGPCVLNSVAIATEYVKKVHHAQRILIIDWGLTHGSGTQQIFIEDRCVLVMSIHRRGEDPDECSEAYDVGLGPGEGHTINVTFDGAPGDSELLVAFEYVLLPVAKEFNPDFILISAGFDSADPLGECQVDPKTFASMTSQLARLASGRILAVLEEGNNLASIVNCTLEVCDALLKSRCHHEEIKKADAGQLCQSSFQSIKETIEEHRPFWKSLRNLQIGRPSEDVPAEAPRNDAMDETVVAMTQMLINSEPPRMSDDSDENEAVRAAAASTTSIGAARQDEEPMELDDCQHDPVSAASTDSAPAPSASTAPEAVTAIQCLESFLLAQSGGNAAPSAQEILNVLEANGYVSSEAATRKRKADEMLPDTSICDLLRTGMFWTLAEASQGPLKKRLPPADELLQYVKEYEKQHEKD